MVRALDLNEINGYEFEFVQYGDFSTFEDGAAAILDFKLLKFLTVGHAKKVEPLHCAKFRLNRSNPGRHMVIFIIQDGGRRRHH